MHLWGTFYEYQTDPNCFPETTERLSVPSSLVEVRCVQPNTTKYIHKPPNINIIKTTKYNCKQPNMITNNQVSQ